MRDKDVIKAYEKIKISDYEKNKIFNNIMDKRKKSFSWFPIIGFGAIALAVFGMYIFLNNDNSSTIGNQDNKKILEKKKKTNEQVVKTLLNRNVSLENNYRKEIIVSSKKYLKANKIDIEELKEGEELVIKGEEIVSNDNYNSCKGNLIIKRYDDDFSYSTDVVCEGTDQDLSNKKEYVIYGGTLTDVFEIKYGIAVASISNVKKQNYDVLDCDANLIIMNNDGNIRFNKKIESVYTNEDSTVKVVSVNQINNKFYIVLQVANQIHFEPSGAGSLRNHYFLMVLDEKGEELSYKEMLDGNSSLFIDDFIGGDAMYVYFIGSAMNNTTYENKRVIIKIGEDSIDTIPYKAIEESDKKEVARHVVITSYESGYFYGYKYDKSYGSGTYYSAKTIFKMNDKAEEVWETNIDGNINKIVVSDKVYALARSGDNARIYAIRLDGQHFGSNNINDFYNISNFYIEGSRIIFKGTDNKENHFFEIFDDKLNKADRIDIDNTDIKDSFEYSFMQYAKLEDGKVIAGYTVNKKIEESDEVLIVFNK